MCHAGTGVEESAVEGAELRGWECFEEFEQLRSDCRSAIENQRLSFGDDD